MITVRAQEPASTSPDSARAWWQVPASCALIAVTIVIGGWLEFMRPLNHDVAWNLTVAERMVAGDRLYVDLFEINPPLIFWLSELTVHIAELAGLSPDAIYRACVLSVGLLMCLWTLYLTDSLLVGLSLALTTTIAVAGDFGQRDALTAMLLAPLVALRRCKATRTQALLAGASAGIGIALKPHYIVVWVALVAFRPGRESTWGVVLIGSAYLLAVVLFAPEYFGFVREFGGLYADWISRSPAFWLRAEPILLPMLVLGLWLVVRKRIVAPYWAGRFAIAGVASAAAMILQGSGFSYHRIPAVSYAAISVIGLLRRGSLWLFAVTLMISAVLGAYIIGPAWAMTRPSPEAQRAAYEVKRLQGCESILILSNHLQHVFPAARDARIRWIGSVPATWWIGIEGHEAAKARLYGALANDIREADVVVVESPPHDRIPWSAPLLSVLLDRDELREPLAAFAPPDSSGYLYRFDRIARAERGC